MFRLDLKQNSNFKQIQAKVFPTLEQAFSSRRIQNLSSVNHEKFTRHFLLLTLEIVLYMFLSAVMSAHKRI